MASCLVSFVVAASGADGSAVSAGSVLSRAVVDQLYRSDGFAETCEPNVAGLVVCFDRLLAGPANFFVYLNRVCVGAGIFLHRFGMFPNDGCRRSTGLYESHSSSSSRCQWESSGALVKCAQSIAAIIMPATKQADRNSSSRVSSMCRVFLLVPVHMGYG